MQYIHDTSSIVRSLGPIVQDPQFLATAAIGIGVPMAKMAYDAGLFGEAKDLCGRGIDTIRSNSFIRTLAIWLIFQTAGAAAHGA